jgi:hypothetical protein
MYSCHRIPNDNVLFSAAVCVVQAIASADEVTLPSISNPLSVFTPSFWLSILTRAFLQHSRRFPPPPEIFKVNVVLLCRASCVAAFLRMCSDPFAVACTALVKESSRAHAAGRKPMQRVRVFRWKATCQWRSNYCQIK